MTKVITYGTFDLLHYGHIRLLERAKALGMVEATSGVLSQYSGEGENNDESNRFS